MRRSWFCLSILLLASCGASDTTRPIPRDWLGSWTMTAPPAWYFSADSAGATAQYAVQNMQLSFYVDSAQANYGLTRSGGVTYQGKAAAYSYAGGGSYATDADGSRTLTGPLNGKAFLVNALRGNLLYFVPAGTTDTLNFAR